MSTEELAPDEIRAIRERLGLSQTEAGEVIGGGARAFTKYEAGTIKPAAAVANLLRLLDESPQLLEVLTGKPLPNKKVHARSPFEVTGKHIESLDAQALVELTKRLIHGEAFAHMITADKIHVAENITAADEGEDARVEWVGEPAKTRFFRGRINQFQLKAGKIDKKRAGNEVLKPDGNAKKLISEVVGGRGGTYTMLCASNYTHKEIQNRKDAIVTALTSAGISVKRGQVAFMDASMIAGWVNTLPAVAVWVLEKTERSSIGGFRSWDYWAASVEHNLNFVEDGRLTVTREALVPSVAQIRSVRRIVGASGVGKSRLVLEAFRATNDTTPSPALLSKALIYVDEGMAGTNAVKLALQNMADSGTRAIVVVDRCPIETHRELSSLVKRNDSQLSLITIDDEIPSVPDNDTIVLGKSSKSVTDGILKGLAENVPTEDFSRVARFADGFPKIATLLAEYLTKGAMTADIPVDLAQTFVIGKTSSDPDLIVRGAQILGLFGFVYDREIDTVAAFGRNLDGQALRAAISRLEDRGILQRKGDGFMLQPKPIALALAQKAWRELGPSRWDEIITSDIPDSLKDRATDQLALLNTTQVGTDVGTHLLRWNGPLSSMEMLASGGNHALFVNLAVVDLEAALSILSRALQSLSDEQIRALPGPVRRSLVRALEKICFKEETFERGAALMLRLAVNETESWGNNSTGQFISLFPVQLGDTEAGFSRRISVLRDNLVTEDSRQKLIIVKALLEAIGLNSFSRTIGPEIHGFKPALVPWFPKTWEELWEYVETACEMLIDLAAEADDNAVSAAAKQGLGHHLRSLVTRGRFSIVEKAIAKLTTADSALWPEATESLGHAIEYDSAEAEPADIAKVQAFLEMLSPKSILDRVNYLVLNMPWDYPCGEGLEFKEQSQRQIDDVQAFAHDLLSQPGELKNILPYLVEIPPPREGRNQQRRVFHFGAGMAKFSTDPREWLPTIITAIENVAKDQRDYSLLTGYLSELHRTDPEYVETVKRTISKSENMAVSLPFICAAIDVKDDDIPLCLSLLDAGIINPWHFSHWQYGRSFDNVSPKAAGELFEGLFSQGGSAYVVGLNLLGMYIHGRHEILEDFMPQIKLIAENANTKTERNNGSQMDEHHFKQIMHWVIAKGRTDADAREVATILVRHLIEDVGSLSEDLIEPLLPDLLANFPDVSWAILGKAIVADSKNAWRLERVLGDKYTFGEVEEPAILALPEEILFAWCQANPQTGPAFLAGIVPVLTSRRTEDVIREIHPVMKRLIDEFGDEENVLDAITRNIGTYGWSGSRAKYYELYEMPLKTLETHRKRRVRFWAIDMLKNLGLEKAHAKSEQAHFEAENDF